VTKSKNRWIVKKYHVNSREIDQDHAIETWF
jgi:hypothetical protein